MSVVYADVSNYTQALRFLDGRDETAFINMIDERPQAIVRGKSFNMGQNILVGAASGTGAVSEATARTIPSATNYTKSNELQSYCIMHKAVEVTDLALSTTGDVSELPAS